MIALAGMIGTGLFFSSGKALAQAGPLGCVLGFGVVSCSCFIRVNSIPFTSFTLKMGTVTASIGE